MSSNHIASSVATYNREQDEEIDPEAQSCSSEDLVGRRKLKSPKCGKNCHSPRSSQSASSLADEADAPTTADNNNETAPIDASDTIPAASSGESIQTERRLVRRHKPRQFDENYIDSSTVFQTIRLQQQEIADEIVPVDVEANILAEMDEVGYNEAKLRDADNILHQCLLPMSFPFSEFQPFPYSDVMRTFPRDIDEMPEVLAMEDYAHAPFENGPFGYGKYEVGKSMKATYPSDYEVGIRAATRRTLDPGVIEITIINNDNRAPEPSSVAAASAEHFAHGSLSCRAGAQEDSSPRRSSRKRKCSHSRVIPDSKPAFLMDYYQRFQASKAMKLSHANSFVEKKLVSVRFASVSSRSTLLDDDLRYLYDSNPRLELDASDRSTKRLPIVVKAVLPLEVQAGRTLNVQTANENADKLGSYDMRFGMPMEKASSAGNRPRRMTTGRTRQVWTKAHSGAGTSSESSSSRHRLAYSSLLHGSRVDVALFRRPREVAVIVRLNGIWLSHEQNVAFSPKAVMDRPTGPDGESVTVESGLSEKTISTAIAAAAGTASSSKSKRKNKLRDIDKEPKIGEPLCFLKEGKLLQMLLCSRRATAKRTSKAVDATNLVDVSDPSSSDFIQPALVCLPTGDGLIRVVCITPGDLKVRWVPAVLSLDSEDSQVDKCSVCFGSDSTEAVESCIYCSVRVHLSCCANKGTRSANKNGWVCASCTTSESEFTHGSTSLSGRKRKSKTPFRFRDDERNEPAEENRRKENTSALQCQICPHSGGAMSPIVGTDAYVHEVCRIWTQHAGEIDSDSERIQEISRNPLINRMRTCCALCGSLTLDVAKPGVQQLIRCAASGCHVRFHPMCGLLASKIATSKAQGEMPPDKLGRMNILDSQLCKQYTLTMLKCSSAYSMEEPIIRPVAFCGLHNPIRNTCLYGCLPCGGIVGDAMRIPSLNRI